ncbi:hypothetical protein ABEG17_16990 [Pedococcus sp. KACC 23699]|uniref:V-type ATPase subunit n=1 Tax=Pedococcus sp. KACC 23699 TaxID=3149228 RepID=A0AAU7JSH7_9MICO
MTQRRLGRRGAAALATSTSLEEGLVALRQTAYGRMVHPGQDLAEAQRAVTAAWLWNVRVLAGWSPRQGVVLLRPLVAPLEVANTLDHLQRLQGHAVPPPHQLGGLATAWPRLARTTSAADLRTVLASSAWGDPGETAPRAVGLYLRAVLAEQVVSLVPTAGSWAAGALALTLAGLLDQDGGSTLPLAVPAARVLGRGALQARTLAALREALPSDARWALADVDDLADLWRAESRWWTRVEQDAAALVHHAGSGREPVVGAVALLAVDAWRVRAALERAADGGRVMEAFDAVA